MLRMGLHSDFLSLQKALPAVANRKTECSFQTGFGITIGDIGENNRRYFQNIRTFSVNAYVFSAKCLLLFAKSQAFRSRKPVFSASKVSIWLFSSLRMSETDKDSVMKNRYLLSFVLLFDERMSSGWIVQSGQPDLSSGTEISWPRVLMILS